MIVGASRARPDRTDLRRWVNLWDDFATGNIEDGEIGDLGWAAQAVDGNNGSILRTVPVPGTGNKFGSIGVRAGVGAGAGAYGISTGGEYFDSADFAVGSILTIRTYVADATAMTWWAGFTGHADPVNTTDATKFIGFRSQASVDGNVYGVIKDGTAGGGAEDTASLMAQDTTNWVTYTMERTAALTFKLSANNGASTATLTTTNYPATGSTMHLMIGMQATGAADRDLEIDLFGLRCSLDRR